MKSIRHNIHRSLNISLATATGLVLLSGSAAYAVSPVSPAPATQQATVQTIITKGDAEIVRRLASLSALTSKIASAKRLSTSDQAALSTEVTAEVSGLNSLKTKLDAETTVTGARTDAQSIYSEYRVYALILPKVYLTKTADSQQLTEAKLTALIQKLQTRIDAVKARGKDVTSLQTALTDMTTQVNNASTISKSIQSKVLPLQPSDYNSDHTILGGDAAQLKTAHADNVAAVADAKTIVAGLKGL